MPFVNKKKIIFCQELQSGVVDLLIHTPNSFADVGSNTDRCTFRSHLFISKHYPESITSNFIKTFFSSLVASQVSVEPSCILGG